VNRMSKQHGDAYPGSCPVCSQGSIGLGVQVLRGRTTLLLLFQLYVPSQAFLWKTRLRLAGDRGEECVWRGVQRMLKKVFAPEHGDLRG
jgi:hypothetical protein